MENIARVENRIDELTEEMVKFLGEIIRFPALSPISGGEGELDKAIFIEKKLKEYGFTDIKRYDAPDPDAKQGIRPNIIATVKGEIDEWIWVISHIDIVPPGDLEKWNTDPYQAVVKDGRIYGRGVEDNGQELAASIFALKAMLDTGVKPRYNIGLILVADEETASTFGISHLLEQNIFGKDDMIIVPDGGNEEGTLMEVAEKSIMWVKVETIGKQCHASMPDLGNNAFSAAMEYGHVLEGRLKSKFIKRNEIFDRPMSTFEPTKKEGNVPNVNTIPGEDVFYFDCRVLPEEEVEEVWQEFQNVATEIEAKRGVKIKPEIIQKEIAAPPTSPDAKIVRKLKSAIEAIHHTQPFAGGIGGGTCAAILRRAGHPAVVWAKIDDTCHGPNEYCIIDNMVKDSKVFANMFLTG